MFVQTQQLDYPDHADEIAHLNTLLAQMQGHHLPELKGYIDGIIARIDYLMARSKPVLKLYGT
jgi:hypothetical protein